VAGQVPRVARSPPLCREDCPPVGACRTLCGVLPSSGWVVPSSRRNVARASLLRSGGRLWAGGRCGHRCRRVRARPGLVAGSRGRLHFTVRIARPSRPAARCAVFCPRADGFPSSRRNVARASLLRSGGRLWACGRRGHAATAAGGLEISLRRGARSRLPGRAPGLQQAGRLTGQLRPGPVQPARVRLARGGGLWTASRPT